MRFAIGFAAGMLTAIALGALAAEISGAGPLRGWVVMDARGIVCIDPDVHPTRKILHCIVQAPPAPR